MENKNNDEMFKNNKIESNGVTREINLDELYDGAINNTTIIDPVTNNEILIKEKKFNFTLIGIILSVLILLILYYINNKTVLGSSVKEVEVKTTTNPVVEEITKNKSGTITCNYSSHSDSDTQKVTYSANYENNYIKDSVFIYDVISNNEQAFIIVEDLKKQYENYYINNSSLIGSSVLFEKNDKGFTFKVLTDYAKAEFDSIIMLEGQTILYVKPNKDDTYEKVILSYTNKGFSCSLNSKEE